MLLETGSAGDVEQDEEPQTPDAVEEGEASGRIGRWEGWQRETEERSCCFDDCEKGEDEGGSSSWALSPSLGEPIAESSSSGLAYRLIGAASRPSVASESEADRALCSDESPLCRARSPAGRVCALSPAASYLGVSSRCCAGCLACPSSAMATRDMPPAGLTAAAALLHEGGVDVS